MNRRNYLSLAGGAALSTSLAGCSDTADPSAAEGESAAAAATDTATVTRTATAQPTTTPTAGPETATSTPWPTTAAPDAGSSESAFGPFTYEHSGPGTTEELDLVQAPLTAGFTHSGSRNFQVYLTSMEGSTADDHLLANVIGSIEGSTVVPIRTAGPYVLEVEADGDWAVRLEQQTDPQTYDLPVEAQGTGPAAYGPYRFGGATRFSATHSGSRNFIVEVVPVSTTAFGDIVYNEMGAVDASTVVRINGPAYLSIDADGEWTLTSD